MTYQSEPLTLWIDRRLVLRPSTIHGIGTFTIAPIPAGQLLIVTTGGLILPAHDGPSDVGALAADLYNEEWLSDHQRVLTPKVFHYYVNHCCQANAVDLSWSATSTQYSAWRNIPAQAEITTDYGLLGARIAPCQCGAARCRGQVTADDWRQATLQESYRGYVSRYMAQQSLQPDDVL